MDRKNLIKLITQAAQAATSRYFRVLSKELYERNREETIKQITVAVDKLLKKTVDAAIQNVDGLFSDDITVIDTSEIVLILFPEESRLLLAKSIKQETLTILAKAMARECNLYLDIAQETKVYTDEMLLQIPIEQIEEFEWEYLEVAVENTPPSVMDKIVNLLAAVAAAGYWHSIVTKITEEFERATIRAQRIFQNNEVGTQNNRSRFKNFLAGIFNKTWRKSRGRVVGQTEASNAINGSRKATIQSMREDAHLPVRAVWISALLPTTRDGHAALDGVPEDENGNWSVNGIDVPYPAHFTLPPEDRVNCLCSIMHEVTE